METAFKESYMSFVLICHLYISTIHVLMYYVLNSRVTLFCILELGIIGLRLKFRLN